MKVNRFCFFLILCFLQTVCVQSAAQSLRNYKYNPTPGEISIIASTPIPYGIKPSHSAYIDLVDCGFNVGMEQATLEYFKQQFELIGDLNFKYMIQNPALFNNQRSEFIEAFKNEPKFAGWKFKDEPLFNDLSNLKNQNEALYKAYPQKLIYINLVGVISQVFTGPYQNFAQYLDYIEEILHPEIWSYDFYPIITKQGKTICENELFYYALETFSAQAKKTSRPFWAYCESMQYKTNTYSRPAANEAYLRFEAFSALAYGAQGIVYWTYGQRQPGQSEDYISALVNINGKKTSAWKAAKKVNAEIKKFNDVFFGCNVKELKHTGDIIYKGTKKLSGTFGPFKMIRSGNSGVVASLIENNGSVYIVIVSRDVFKKQKVSLELLPNQSVVDLNAAIPVQYSWRKDIVFNLDKGGYKIFRVI